MEPSSDAITVHDQQRHLPEPIFQSLISQLTDRLRLHQPCLDAGAGSGMITVPLARAGNTMTALDRSPAMLTQLTERAADTTNLTIVLGDLTALPFADQMFGSVLVANVFHLIAAWERALTELARVLRHHGVLLVNLGGAGEMPDDLIQLTEHFLRQLGDENVLPQASIGPASVEAFEAAVRSKRLVPVTPVIVEYHDVITPEAVIQRLERNIFARPGTASASAAQVAQAGKSSREWANATLAAIDRPYGRTQRIHYRVYAR